MCRSPSFPDSTRLCKLQPVNAQHISSQKLLPSGNSNLRTPSQPTNTKLPYGHRINRNKYKYTNTFATKYTLAIQQKIKNQDVSIYK
jgi:hypothetical protein